MKKYLISNFYSFAWCNEDMSDDPPMVETIEPSSDTISPELATKLVKTSFTFSNFYLLDIIKCARKHAQCLTSSMLIANAFTCKHVLDIHALSKI